MANFVVIFRYDASPEALGKLRPERYRYFAGLQSSGHLLASGQLIGGELGDGMLVLDASTEDAARSLLKNDPYMREGYVSGLDVVAWRPTTGTWVD